VRAKPTLRLGAGATLVLGLLLQTAAPASGAVGLFEKVQPRYYAGRIDLHVGPKQILPRSEFMAPYSDDTLLFLKTRGMLDGYAGADLALDRVVDRRSVAFLMGRFLQLVEARHGRIFPEVASDRIHLVLEPDMWGHRQVELALRADLLRPYKVSDWWRRPLSRYELATISARAVQGLSRRLRIFRYHDGEPAVRYRDLHVYPTLTYWNLARALKTGVVEGAGPEFFGGKEPVRGHELARTLRRLLLIAQAYDPLA
jgi:hypothetical protein